MCVCVCVYFMFSMEMIMEMMVNIIDGLEGCEHILWMLNSRSW